jgi:Xaa-Pro aminopeptidase
MNKEIVKEALKKQQLDAILFFSPENRFWMTDFASSLGYLFTTSQENYLFVDGRYFTAAQNLAKNCQVYLWKSVEDIKKFLEKLQIKKIAFEKEYITIAQWEKWQKQMPNFQWIGVETNKLRIIKTKEEIERIRQAAKITDQTYQKLLKEVKPGMREKDLAKIIFNSFEELGAEGISFETIVASGKRGALPHGQASEKIIQEGELITVDFGCKYQGYCSDFTRTFALGKTIDPKLQEIYQIVQQAQEKGIKSVKAGIKCSEVDQIVRNYIQEKGYGEYFIHSTGHGLGIEVHEEPGISTKDETILQTGMIITIEPGIYLPHLGGVRIEDDILVTGNGYELLTKSPRELIYI